MGGGAAGKISYPEYISLIHSKFLDHEGLDVPTLSITDVFNTTVINNPFVGEVAFNPDIELARAYNDIVAFRTLANTLNPSLDYPAFMLLIEDAVDAVINTDYITSPIPTVPVDESALADDTAAYALIQTNLLENTVLPPWKAGMHNINAVTSSAFVIGEAILRGMNQADIARYSTGVRTQIVARNSELNAGFITQRQDTIAKFNVQRNEMIRASTSVVMNATITKNEIFNEIAARAINYAQIHIASKYDEMDVALNIAESDVKWELGLFQPVGAFIGAMSAGGGATGARRPSRLASTAGGALTGASVGAQTGTWYGAVAGAVIGAGLGYASAS